MEDAECLLAEEQIGSGQKLWSSNNHYTLRQVALRRSASLMMVHVGMPQPGVATRKRKHYGFKFLEFKFLDSKKSVLRIQNKESLCLARLLVTGVARQKKYIELNSIRIRCKEQRLVAQQLHQKASVQEGLCGIPEVDKFQEVVDNYQTIVLSAKHFSAIGYKGPR